MCGLHVLLLVLYQQVPFSLGVFWFREREGKDSTKHYEPWVLLGRDRRVSLANAIVGLVEVFFIS